MGEGGRTCVDQPGRAGVSEVMKAGRGLGAGSSGGGGERALVPEVVADGGAGWRREDERGGLVASWEGLRQVGLELGVEEVRQADLTFGVCLGRADDQGRREALFGGNVLSLCLGDLLERLVHGQLAAEVDVVAAQGPKLARSEPGVGGDEDRKLPMGAEQGDEAVDLLVGQRVDVEQSSACAGLTRELDARGGVRGDVAVFDGGPEDATERIQHAADRVGS